MTRLTPAGELLVMLQVASLASDAEQQELVTSFIEGLTTANINVVSVYLQLNDTTTDAARPDAPLLFVHGKQRLEMPLLGLRFEIGPMSFFQANSAACVGLYEKALEWLRPVNSVVFDICCGVGTIGLCAARRCRRVVGLELVPEAVESARQNAALNRIENASFIVGKAEETLPELLRDINDDDVCAVVDPPRPGLHWKVLQALRNCARLSRLVYVSCNPESLADDVVKLTTPREGIDPFVPVRAVAVDMFPHTLHCEMILLMERSNWLPDPTPTSAPQVETARTEVAQGDVAKLEHTASNIGDDHVVEAGTL